MHDAVAVQEGHTAQDLPQQAHDVLLGEGFVLLGHALLEDLPAGSTGSGATW